MQLKKKTICINGQRISSNTAQPLHASYPRSAFSTRSSTAATQKSDRQARTRCVKATSKPLSRKVTATTLASSLGYSLSNRSCTAAWLRSNCSLKLSFPCCVLEDSSRGPASCLYRAACRLRSSSRILERTPIALAMVGASITTEAMSELSRSGKSWTIFPENEVRVSCRGTFRSRLMNAICCLGVAKYLYGPPLIGRFQMADCFGLAVRLLVAELVCWEGLLRTS